jgi:transcriptional regulator with XRE-family HTH domain
MNEVETRKVGDLLREWRGRRRLSQLDLAYDAEISPKHLSFVETGRAQPSREMVLRLAEQLALPLRERNILLTAAGFAAVFPERNLDDESLAAARKVVDVILSGLEPNPSFAVDRHWNLIAANKAVGILLSEVDPPLLEPPVNILRLCLHPKGFTPQILNYAEWRSSIFDYLNRLISVSADAFLIEMMRELKSYPPPKSARNNSSPKEFDNSRFAIPLRLNTKDGELSFVSTITVFGTPIDVTLAELAIETFFPADAKTAEIMNAFLSGI